MKGGGEFKVEKLSKNDADELEELLKRVWPRATEYPEKWRRERVIGRRQIIDEMKTGFQYFGVKLSGKIVGFYKARAFGDGYLGEHQSVHPAHRGRGLARAMYKHFIQFAREGGYRRICVNVLRSQVASVKLVQEFGFKKTREYEQIPGMLVDLYELQV
jgi:L-amino acid N-acyltransferase YncA